VVEHYEDLGAEPRPGVSLAEIADCEAVHGLTLPRAVARLYVALDGLAGEVPDFGLHALQLWPLAELTRVSDRVAEYRGIPDYGPIVHTLPNAEEYVAFGDALCWSHVVAVRLAEPGPVLWICGGEYAEVAPTFEGVLGSLPHGRGLGALAA
jgi:hypothetical protein